MRARIRIDASAEPRTCPWRTYEDPVIQAAMTLRRRVLSGVVNVDDQLAIVVEAAEMISSVQSHLELVDLRAKNEAERLARIGREGSR